MLKSKVSALVLCCSQTCSVRFSDPTTLQKLVVRLVLFQLVCGNDVLVGIPAYLLCRLQSVLNAAEWLIFHLMRSDHIMDALVSRLHWLYECLSAFSIKVRY